jgi:hypothetical protein
VNANTEMTYAFVGWALTPGGATVNVAETPLNDHTTFYAVWGAPRLALFVTADAGLRTWNAEKYENIGLNNNMMIRAQTAHGSFGHLYVDPFLPANADIKIGLIRFDVAILPEALEGFSIDAATLRLTRLAGAGTRGLMAAPMGSNWSETGVTWVNHPAATVQRDRAAASNTTTAAGQVFAFDVTPFILELEDEPQISFALDGRLPEDSNQEFQVYAREHASANAVFGGNRRLAAWIELELIPLTD